jgi:signal recognition particle receptor subunit beta
VLEENFDLDTFEMILEYIYGGQIVVSTRKANILEPIAKKFQLKKLGDMLGSFYGTELTDENVIEKLVVYHNAENNRGVEQCLLYLDHIFQTNYLILEQQFLQLPFEVLFQIVKRETIDATESLVFALILKWYNLRVDQCHNTEELHQQMKQLTKCLKLHLLATNPEPFFQHIKPNGWADVELLWEVVAARFYEQGNDPSLYKKRTPGPKIAKKRMQVFKVAILGLKGAGKTSICDYYTKQRNAKAAPTILNLEDMEYGAYTIKFRDFTGSSDGRKLWFSEINKNIDGLIWVIDSTNLQEENIDLINEFMEFVGKPNLPVLLLAHKHDLGKEAASVPEVSQYLRIANRLYFSRVKRTFLEKWHMEGSSITPSSGLDAGLKWLVEAMIAFVIEKSKQRAAKRLH